MSDNDREQRHAHDHDEAEDHDEAHSHADDHGHDAAARRVAEADRKAAGGKTAHDVEAFLFKTEPHGKQTHITFGPSVAAAGDEQAAFRTGMKGYVKLGKDHMVAKFTITSVSRTGQGGNSITAHAIVDVPASELIRESGLTVIVNPSSYPAQAPRTQHDIKARTLAIRREEDFKWLLMAPTGLSNGVREGMHGVGLDVDGNKVGDIVVKTVEDSQCWVEIEANQDTASRVKGVLINPS